MRKSPEAGHPEGRRPSVARPVVKRDGRQVPFDAERLVTSIRRALESAGADDLHAADDLGAVVVTFLAAQGDVAPVPTAEIAELVQQVLANSGCENGAFLFNRVREERDRVAASLRVRSPSRADAANARSSRAGTPRTESEHADAHHPGLDGAAADIAADNSPGGAPGGEPTGGWSKGRVVALLEAETELEAERVRRIASEVERGLFASGLRSVSTPLLREWIDNELSEQGLTARLGTGRTLNVDGHEVREILGGDTRAAEAEAALAGGLLERYALRDVYPPAVARAHEQGLLSLGGLDHGPRQRGEVLSRTQDGAVDMATLAARLRTRVAGVFGRLALVWDAAAPSLAEARALLAGLAREGSAGAEIVIALPLPSAADEACAAARPWLQARRTLRADDALSGLRFPRVRLCGYALPEAVLAEAVDDEQIDDGIEFAAVPPSPGSVSGSVALNLARLALLSLETEGEGALPSFTARFQRALDLALTALSARRALLVGAAGPVERDRLELVGLHEAAALLEQDGEPDLAGLLLVVTAELAARGALADDALILGRADRRTTRRLGRLDRRAHPDVAGLGVETERSTAGKSAGYRYDGPWILPSRAAGDGVDPALRAARAAATLGLSPSSPAPRCTGGAAQRIDFLRTFLFHASTQVEGAARPAAPTDRTAAPSDGVPCA